MANLCTRSLGMRGSSGSKFHASSYDNPAPARRAGIVRTGGWLYTAAATRDMSSAVAISSHETLKQPFPYSLPKDKIKILLLEGISETAVNVLQGAGYTQIDR